MIAYDATHTSHTRAQTGIQRVVRSLHVVLAARGAARPVCYDPYARGWRALRAEELRQLQPGQVPGSSRGAKWTLRQKIAGHATRLARRQAPLAPAEGLICPELFSPRVAAHLPELFQAVRGPRIAIFHDAIGLQLPEMTPPATVARLPAYLLELARFDGIVAVSEDSAASLRDFWSWHGLRDTPPITAIPLGLDSLPAGTVANPPAAGRLRVLCVGTIEGRKNHVALLAACEQLWAAGLEFDLELVGLGRADTGSAALAAIDELRARGRPLSWAGTVSDAALHDAYRRATFTIYPSLREGFGLPVLESLQHGRPCICSAVGALGETARDGGCLALASVDAAGLANGLRQLLTDRATLARLTDAARSRTFRRWDEYADLLLAWMKSQPRRH